MPCSTGRSFREIDADVLNMRAISIEKQRRGNALGEKEDPTALWAH
jgi:hypothetical protein